MTPSRRSFITGLVAFAAAPAIVRASSLMPVRGIVMDAPKRDLYAELADITRQHFLDTYYQKRWWWVENNKVHYGPLIGMEQQT